jgi:hypothetical protein
MPPWRLKGRQECNTFFLLITLFRVILTLVLNFFLCFVHRVRPQRSNFLTRLRRYLDFPSLVRDGSTLRVDWCKKETFGKCQLSTLEGGLWITSSPSAPRGTSWARQHGDSILHRPCCLPSKTLIDTSWVFTGV